ncbi:MAG TPA: winged helix-turn-helix transcriptional regulator [Anaerolineales bacterium]|nr:winged helix-turn-helix transcriptional regulator [Anaerolineales bacterium]
MIDSTIKSTRERVLQTLLKNHRCTIIDLAATVDINPISVRHHISKLQAEGLVVSEEERHGVGRPRQVYSLTEAGLEHFPTRYMRLTIRLLGQLKEHVPPEMVNQLFSKMAADLVHEYASTARTQGLSTEQRLEMVKYLLKEEGFNIEWEKIGDQFHIHEVSCPYFHVGQNHPEVCWIDQTLISTVLDLPTEKIKCVLDGDNYCTYVVVPNTVPALITSEEIP